MYDLILVEEINPTAGKAWVSRQTAPGIVIQEKIESRKNQVHISRTLRTSSSIENGFSRNPIQESSEMSR